MYGVEISKSEMMRSIPAKNSTGCCNSLKVFQMEIRVVYILGTFHLHAVVAGVIADSVGL